MSKRLLAAYECGRCERTWYVDHVEGEADVAPPRIDVLFIKNNDPKTVTFEDLCESCASAVENYLKSIVKEKEPGAKKKPEASSDPQPE